MSSFLTLVSRPDHQAERTLLFRSGLETFRQAKSRAPSATLETAWVSAAAFPRMNGSGTPIVKDPGSGSWLIAAGTWFHRNGLRSGNEAALLERYLEIGNEALAQELEGFFALLIGDGRSREVQVLTDLVGSCHCDVFRIVRELKIPIKLIGLGEHVEDLQPFDPKVFVDALVTDG